MSAGRTGGVSLPDVPELRGLCEAEEFFEALDVPWDPRLLAAHRLRVMKRFGTSLAELVAAGLPADAAERRAALAAALGDAQERVARNAAREGRLVADPPLVRLGVPRRAGS